MKKIYIILIFTHLIALSQKSQKNTSAQFVVDGNCIMCKKTIEKAAFSLKGVKMVNWQISSKQLVLIFDSNRVKLEKIHLAIAESGYDTPIIQAKEENYNLLEKCCRYRD